MENISHHDNGFSDIVIKEEEEEQPCGWNDSELETFSRTSAGYSDTGITPEEEMDNEENADIGSDQSGILNLCIKTEEGEEVYNRGFKESTRIGSVHSDNWRETNPCPELDIAKCQQTPGEENSCQHTVPGESFVQQMRLTDHNRVDTTYEVHREWDAHPVKHNRASERKPQGCSRYLVVNKNVRTREKPHRCHQCGKCFALKNQLVVHGSVHTKETPFKCQECGKCFACSRYLVVHKKVHTREKPHKCQECGKCFASKNQLVAHGRVHTGETPFKCQECGKYFAANANLVRHKRIHTGEKLLDYSLRPPH